LSDATKPTRQRRPSSALGRMRKFFEDNPGEELTYEDVSTKFGCTPRVAQIRITQAVREGWLRRETVIRFNPPKEAP
jgi:hypothetical protein